MSNDNRSLVARAVEIARQHGLDLDDRKPGDLELLQMGIKSARVEYKCGGTKGSKEFDEMLIRLRIKRIDPPTIESSPLVTPTLTPCLAGKGRDLRAVQPPLPLEFSHG